MTVAQSHRPYRALKDVAGRVGRPLHTSTHASVAASGRYRNLSIQGLVQIITIAPFQDVGNCDVTVHIVTAQTVALHTRGGVCKHVETAPKTAAAPCLSLALADWSSPGGLDLLRQSSSSDCGTIHPGALGPGQLLPGENIMNYLP